MSMLKQWRSLLIKLTGSALILWLLFRFVDIDLKALGKQLEHLNLLKYLISLSGVILVLAVKSYRWHLLIRTEGVFYPVRHSFGAYMASYTIGIITPGRIGEIARLYYVRQYADMKFISAFRTIITDRIFDLGVLVMMAIGGILYFGPWPVKNMYIAVIAGVLLFFVGLFMANWFFKYLIRLARFKQQGLLVFLTETIRPAITSQSVKLWLITVLAYLIFYGAIALILDAMSIHLGLIDIAIIISVVGLVTILPVSWAGFGTREVTLVYLLGLYGIPAEAALSFSLLQFTAFFLWGSLVGLVFWLLMPVSIKQIRQDSKNLWIWLQKREPNTAHKK